MSPPMRRTHSSSCRTSPWWREGSFSHAVRDQQDRFLSNGDQSGRRTYDIFSPKVGLLWDVDPTWQVFGNVSRSAEVPTFDVTTFATPASTNVNAQTATTYEIGTRGRRPDFTWDLSLYRADISNELQCLTTWPFSPCTVVNADRTVHQGVEAGLGRGVPQVGLRAARTASGSTSPTPTATSASTATLTWGNNRLPGVPPHSSAPKCSTSIRTASTPARTSSGCRRLSSPTTPTASRLIRMRC